MSSDESKAEEPHVLGRSRREGAEPSSTLPLESCLTKAADAPYDTLVLSGGAAKGLIILGALQYFTDSGMISDITTYVGSSVGAIICYLLAIGYTPVEIMVYVCTHRLIERMQHFDIVAVTNGMGAMSFTPIQETLEKMTLDKVGEFLTLEQLRSRFGKTLVCSTYNMTTQKTEYVGPDTYSDLPCLIALRMSANVPLLFDRFRYRGSSYVDGGISDNFPILTGAKMGERVLGIRLTKELPEGKMAPEPTGVLDYVFKILLVPIRQAVEHRCSLAPPSCTIVALPDEDATMFNFNIKSRVKLEMFSDGYGFARAFDSGETEDIDRSG